MDLGKISLGLRPLVDSEAQLRRHILWFIFIRMVLFTLLLGISVILEVAADDVILPPRSYVVLFISFIFLYSVGSAVVLQKKILRLRRFGLVQILSDTLFTTILVYFTGCSQSIFPPVFIFPIVSGGLILRRIGGLIPAAASVFFFGCILLAEHSGLVPDFFHQTMYRANENSMAAMNIFSVYGLTFFLTAMVSGMLAERLRKTEHALSRTAHELDKLSILYKQIFDDIATGIITIDEADTITSVNNAAERITGYPADDLVGQRLGVRFPEIILQSEHGGRSVADLRCKDNREIRAGYSFSRLNIPPDPDATATACTDSKVITLQDISKIERLEQQMRKSEKMATIGEMSASIAHDFRNPLAAISGSAELLMNENSSLSGDTTGYRLSAIIFRESQRMANIVSDFMQFSRPATPRVEWFSLHPLINEVIANIRGKNGNPFTCEIQNMVGQNVDIQGDRQQLQTVLCHILQNSCEATGAEGDVVFVRAEEKHDNERPSVAITISDQGAGISHEHKGKIFEPFYSTRESSTGLGLAIVRQIMEGHKGRVDIFSESEQGCTVTLTLPLP